MSNIRGALDSSLDPTYVQKMQYMSLDNQPDVVDPRYARIGSKAEPATAPYHHQKQKSIGAIESFTSEAPTQPRDYMMYERNNIIASSKYATPKQVETLTRQEENDIYVQCAKPQVPPNASPTHSLSGSSTGSPRASLATNPVYENIDYYANNLPFYHGKAQPQVPFASRNTREGEALPVYENVATLTHKTSGATPGPQVASSQAPPPYPGAYNTYQPQPMYNKGQFYNYKTNNFSQQQLDEINNSDYVCMTGNISHTLSTNVPFQTTSARNYNREPATGIASTPSVLPKKEVKKIEVRPPLAPSPTPSACSTLSGTGKLKISGKTLLPYNVTPPRPRGPTEAERKIEEMTRQIEEEMEKHEEEGEYFGEFASNLYAK